MKKDVLTVKELAVAVRMSVKSIQRAYRKEEIPAQWSLCSLVVASGYSWSQLVTAEYI